MCSFSKMKGSFLTALQKDMASTVKSTSKRAVKSVEKDLWYGLLDSPGKNYVHPQSLSLMIKCKLPAEHLSPFVWGSHHRKKEKKADFHLQPSHVDATQEGIKAGFLRDLDLHTFPVSRYRQRLLTHMHTRGMSRYRTVTWLNSIHVLFTKFAQHAISSKTTSAVEHWSYILYLYFINAQCGFSSN